MSGCVIGVCLNVSVYVTGVCQNVSLGCVSESQSVSLGCVILCQVFSWFSMSCVWLFQCLCAMFVGDITPFI